VRQHEGTLRARPLRVGRDIGVEIHGGDAVVLIRTGSRAPVAQMMTFTTVADGQRAVEVRLVRGGDPAGAVVGRFLLSGLRSVPRGDARIDVGVSLDAGGVLHAWASDRATGARQEAWFPGLWAIDAGQRGEALAQLTREVGPALSEPGGGPSDRATALATIAGEMRVLRRPRYDN
jgi:hypothetical protein